jgi:Na+/proline symporter
MTISRTLAVGLAGAILAAAGTILPWVTASAGIATLSRTGLELGGDAQILAAAAVIAALALLWGKRTGAVFGMLAGIAVVVIGYADLQDIQRRVANLDTATGTVGPGIWVSLLGGVLLAAGSFMAWREAPAAKPDVPPPPADVTDAAG